MNGCCTFRVGRPEPAERAAALHREVHQPGQLGRDRQQPAARGRRLRVRNAHALKGGRPQVKAVKVGVSK